MYASQVKHQLDGRRFRGAKKEKMRIKYEFIIIILLTITLYSCSNQNDKIKEQVINTLTIQLETNIQWNEIKANIKKVELVSSGKNTFSGVAYIFGDNFCYQLPIHVVSDAKHSIVSIDDKEKDDFELELLQRTLKVPEQIDDDIFWYNSIGEILTRTNDDIPASVDITLGVGIDRTTKINLDDYKFEIKDSLRTYFHNRSFKDLNNKNKTEEEIVNIINNEVFNRSVVSKIRFDKYEITE
jgi:hypothetical protein